jgi:hypothetical protein
MKLRVTKGRIACAVVMLPVFCVLNAGPMFYIYTRFPSSRRVIGTIYDPFLSTIYETPLGNSVSQYLEWWVRLAM